MSATIEHLQRPMRNVSFDARPATRGAATRAVHRHCTRREPEVVRQFRRHSVLVGVIAITVACTLLLVVQPALGQPASKHTPIRVTGPTALAPATLAPGRPETHVVSLTNSSNDALRYTIKTRTTGSARLAASVSVVVKRDVARCTTNGFARSGTVIARGTLATFRETTGSYVLRARATDQLCVQQRLPADAGNTFQNLRVQAKLLVEYTQAKP